MKILENGKWIEDLDLCIMDYEIFLNGNTYFYHSDCGTFSKFNISKASTMSKDEPENIENIFIADENTKDKVNSMLKKYN